VPPDIDPKEKVPPGRVVGFGEGFRTPALTGRAWGAGPAYGNLPSTNPRGTGATLWGFENSGAAVQAARAIYQRGPVVIAIYDRVVKAMRWWRATWSSCHRRGHGIGDWRRRM